MEITTILLLAAAFALGFAISWIVGRTQLTTATQEQTALTTKLELKEQELDTLKDELEFAKSERTQFHERVVTAETKLELLQKELEKKQEQQRLEFSDTATKIFDNFNTKSEKQIGDLLSPLRERLNEFQKKIDDSFTAQGKEQHTLKAEIEKIVLQTDGLTKALKGDVKAQGNWGEVMLERILEQSGLRKGEEYITQGEGMNLTNETGGRLLPDVIVNLPNEKHIIIDSKVSLTYYERYCNETDETAKLALVREFIKSIKAHVNNLASKEYQTNNKLNTPDVIMMFMPVEGAFSLAVQEDIELCSHAWKKNIAIVSPTNLFFSLKTVAFIWNKERGYKNVDEILDQSGKLYDRFCDFISDMEKINKGIENLNTTYDNAIKKINSGNGNIMRRIENLKILGAKTSKSLPKSKEELAESEEV